MELSAKSNWKRWLYVIPSALSVTAGLLLWMVKITWIDRENLEQPQQKAIADFVIDRREIETVVEVPVKPPEPMAQPQVEPLKPTIIDQQALNMRPEIKLEAFQKPKLEIASNFSYMGLGRRRVVGSRAKPSYPREAKNAQVEGTVYLEFDINKRGIPTNIRVLESHPVGVFDKAAISAVKKWRYARKFSDGVAISTPNFRNRLNFRLDEMNLAAAE